MHPTLHQGFALLGAPAGLERILLEWNRLSAGISGSGKERGAPRYEYRQRRATMSGARKTKLKRLRFACSLSGLITPAWRAFPRRASSKSSRDIHIAAAVFLAGPKNPCHQTVSI
jgi:hypothetical protein